MKTTQHKAVNAYIALIKLSRATLKGRVARDLFMLKTKLEPSWNFQKEEQDKYIKEYNGTLDDDGNLRFSNQDDRDQFDKKINEIAEIETEFDIEPVQIKCDDIEISVSDIEALAGFVEFTD